MAASAMHEPDTEPIRVASASDTWPTPPRMWPVRTVDNRSMRSVMPAKFIRLPDRMNIGMARSAKFCVWVTVSCTGMVKGGGGGGGGGQVGVLDEEQGPRDADRETRPACRWRAG